MKKLFVILFAASMATFISSCKKEKTYSLDGQITQHNSDADFYKGESDQADNDINNDLQNHPSVGRVQSGSNNILSSPMCGVTIDTHDSLNKIIYYNFDGVTPCFSPSRTRSGQIKVELTSGTNWGDVGSMLTLTYTNFKITRLYDNKSVMFNGVKTLKNINGNDWLGFLLGTATLKYQERALNVAVTFDGNASATWNLARMTQWSYNATSGIIFSCSGDTTINGYSGADIWGTNRFGQSFTTNYNSTVVSNTYCGLWRFNSGEVVYHVNAAAYTFTLGVDQTGNPTPYACAYGFKVSWVPAGTSTSQTVILSY